MTYTREECIEALQEASQKFEATLSVNEYKQTDFKPVATTIINKFGSWNEAKEKAGLETITEEESWKKNDNSTDFEEIPENEEFTVEEWKNLSKPQRHYYRNKKKIKERAVEHNKKQKKKNREWIKEVKEQSECERCGEERKEALQFHHIDKEQKEKSVSRMVHEAYPIDTIMEEIEKCEVLCANCHQVYHIRSA